MDVLKFDTAALASQVALQAEEVICPICQVRVFNIPSVHMKICLPFTLITVHYAVILHFIFMFLFLFYLILIALILSKIYQMLLSSQSFVTFMLAALLTLTI